MIDTRKACFRDLALIVALLAIYYAWPLLVPGMAFHGGDATLLTYPNRLLLREGLLNGIMPLWNPYAGLGVPALAEYQGAFLYPLNWLSCLFNPMTSSRLLAFFHILLQSIGTYALARWGCGFNRRPAMFAAVAQGVSSWNAAHIEQFMISATAAWTPLILCGWMLYLRRPGSRAALLTVSALTMAILAGHSQYWLYTIDLMALLLLVEPFRPTGQQIVKRKALKFVALAGIVLGACALSAAQLLPTLELARHSERVSDAPEYGMHASFPPDHLLYYLDPLAMPRWYEEMDPFRPVVELMPFIGRLTLALAVLALLTHLRRRLAWSLLLWAVVPLVLSFGGFLPNDGWLFRMAQAILPGWDGLRVPARLLSLTNLAVVLLAALGLQWLIERSSRLRPQLIKFIPLLACLIVMAEQWPVSWRLPLRHASKFTQPDPAASLIDNMPESDEPYRVFRLIDTVPIARFDAAAHAARLATLEPNTGVYAGVGTVRAYVEGLLPLLRTEDFLRAYWRNFYTPTPDAELLGLMNVQYIASDKPVEGSHWTVLKTLPPAEYDRRPIVLLRNERYRGRVFPLADLQQVDPTAFDGLFVSTGSSTPPAQNPRALPQIERTSATVSVLQQTMNSLDVETNTIFNGPLVFSGSAYPGWLADWGTGRVALVPLNAIHQSFSLPPDIHRAQIIFEPMSYKIGLFISLAAFTLLIGWLWLTIRAPRT